MHIDVSTIHVCVSFDLAKLFVFETFSKRIRYQAVSIAFSLDSSEQYSQNSTEFISVDLFINLYLELVAINCCECMNAWKKRQNQNALTQQIKPKNKSK